MFAKTVARQKLIQTKPAHFHTIGHPNAIHFAIIPTHEAICSYLANKSPIIHGLARVLTTILFKPTRANECGVAWQELYLLSLIATLQPMQLHNDGSAKARDSIHRKLAKFRIAAM